MTNSQAFIFSGVIDGLLRFNEPRGVSYILPALIQDATLLRTRLTKSKLALQKRLRLGPAVPSWDYKYCRSRRSDQEQNVHVDSCTTSTDNYFYSARMFPQFEAEVLDRKTLRILVSKARMRTIAPEFERYDERRRPLPQFTVVHTCGATGSRIVNKVLYNVTDTVDVGSVEFTESVLFLVFARYKIFTLVVDSAIIPNSSNNAQMKTRVKKTFWQISFYFGALTIFTISWPLNESGLIAIYKGFQIVELNTFKPGIDKLNKNSSGKAKNIPTRPLILRKQEEWDLGIPTMTHKSFRLFYA
ncbi:hypothetical protein BDP27DRAFT_1364806 [Rhodocollybia butyracea]|uniref:Uncharacterized protein n=1 Tax=Rhodocollybia butyracea TaxID=206335 RepID=A0A9P5U6D0_9AGAR|nr:hypothetical protein BDP27DRAFT_1364806 [Rhodocollybia butyracea]